MRSRPGGLVVLLGERVLILELVDGFVQHLAEDLVQILLERRPVQQRAGNVRRGRRRLTYRLVAAESRRFVELGGRRRRPCGTFVRNV